jgi:hypothetical protein
MEKPQNPKTPKPQNPKNMKAINNIIFRFHSVYLKGSFDLSNVSKYGCNNAIFAEILLFGSRAVMHLSRSTSNSLRVGVWSYMAIPLNLGNVALKSVNLRASGQFPSFGVPNTLKILKI